MVRNSRILRGMILHITTREEWQTAQRNGSYAPSSLGREGFIHCSTLRQVVETANAYFRGTPDLVLLLIDEGKVRAPLRHEAPVGGRADSEQRSPHLYRPLELDAVTQVIAFPPNPDGRFALPASLPPER